MSKAAFLVMVTAALAQSSAAVEYVRPPAPGLAELARARGKHFGSSFSGFYWGWGWQKKPVDQRRSVYANDAGTLNAR